MKNDLIHFVTEGQTISARNQNAIIRQVRSLVHGPGFYIDGTGVYARRLHRTATEVVRIQNNSGEDRNAYEVLGIDAPLATPGEDPTEFHRPSFTGSSPDIDDHFGRFAVLLDPVPAGQIARACIDGICSVQINVTREVDRRADVKTGQTSWLRSGSCGAADILWKETGTGVKWAKVRIGNVAGWFSGVLDENLAGGAANHATVSIYQLNAAETAWTDAGWDLEGYAPPLLPSAKQIASGTWVDLDFRDDRFYVREAGCGS